jgi:hypothetical protein
MSAKKREDTLPFGPFNRRGSGVPLNKEPAVVV